VIIDKDVVVVGLGGFGSAALWRLAARGVDVAGIERQGIGHPFGSSHGITRLFRIACMEHPDLPPIAMKSLELWTELGGDELVRQTGCLTTGTPDGPAVRGALDAAARAGVPVVELDHDELLARQPQYAGVAPEEVGVWDPGAGICFPEPVVRAHTAAARGLGADVFPHTMVTAIEPDAHGVTVRTPTVAFRANQVVVTAGAWLGALVPGLPLTVRRTPMFWFAPRDPGSTEFELAGFPAFIWHRGGADLWGHGSGEGFGVKIGLADAGTSAGGVDAEELDRYIHPAGDFDQLSAEVASAFPGLDPRPASVIPCLVTDTPDGQFVIGRLADRPRIVLAGGDSGHGFKHAAGIGELLALLTLDEQPYCATEFTDPERFR
jgi:sarcosine oxidase